MSMTDKEFIDEVISRYQAFGFTPIYGDFNIAIRDGKFVANPYCCPISVTMHGHGTTGIDSYSAGSKAADEFYLSVLPPTTFSWLTFDALCDAACKGKPMKVPSDSLELSLLEALVGAGLRVHSHDGIPRDIDLSVFERVERE